MGFSLPGVWVKIKGKFSRINAFILSLLTPEHPHLLLRRIHPSHYNTGGITLAGSSKSLFVSSTTCPEIRGLPRSHPHPFQFLAFQMHLIESNRAVEIEDVGALILIPSLPPFYYIELYVIFVPHCTSIYCFFLYMLGSN